MKGVDITTGNVDHDMSERDICPRCIDILEIADELLPAFESDVRPLVEPHVDHLGSLEDHTLDSDCMLHIPFGYTRENLLEMEYDVELISRGSEFVIDITCYEAEMSEFEVTLDVGPVK